MQVRLFIPLLVLLLMLICCCGPGASGNESGGFLRVSYLFLEAAELRKAEFEHVDARYLKVLFDGDDAYVLGRRDHRLAKFSGGKLVKNHRSRWLGNGGLINASRIFWYDGDTIGVYDHEVCALILFDKELKFLRQQYVTRSVTDMVKRGSTIYAGGYFGGENFALLDDKLEIRETFGRIPENTRGPFFEFFHYGAFLLPDLTVAATTKIQFEPECVVEIIDVVSKKRLRSLRWLHPHPPTQKELDNRRNWYSTHLVARYGDYYVVQNIFQPDAMDFDGKKIHDLLVFSSDGTLLSRFEDVGCLIVPSAADPRPTRIFFVDGGGNLQYWDLEDFSPAVS
jgi:hypothetical protein